MSETSARLGGKRAATVSRNGPMKYSLAAMERPEMITFGGANRVMRLAMAKPKALPASGQRANAALVAIRGPLQQERHAAARAKGRVVLAAAHDGLRFAEHRSLRSDVGQAPAAVARRPNHEVAEVGAEPVRAAEQFAVMQDAEPQCPLHADDKKVVDVARLPEPMFGERDKIDVAVDRCGDAEPLGEIGAERHVAFAEYWTLAADAGGALDHPGQPDADAVNVGHLEIGVGDAAAHPVLDKVGDHRRGLPVDADRQRKRAQDIGAEVRRRHRDLVGRELHPHDMGRVRIEPEHDARPAAAAVANGADLHRHDQTIVQQGRGDRRDRRRAEFGELGNFDAGDRTKPPDRVHHMEAIDRAHQFRVGGFHRS